MGKRFFTNEEIKKWNDILEKNSSNFLLEVHNNTKSILIYEKPNSFISPSKFTRSSLLERRNFNHLLNSFNHKSFRHNFCFSVIKKRSNEFFKILESFTDDGIEVGHFESEIEKFDLKKEINNFKQTEHTIGNNDLIRIQYSFTNILSAMFVTALIEDTISFFELMWEYSEDGEEKCLLQYPIGNIVSLKDKKNIDYMVSGYELVRPNSILSIYKEKPFFRKFDPITNPTILYDLVCIESGINSGIIRYGSSCIAQENDICPSRTNNLNIILN
jgi:hypothetical protein